MPGRWIRVRKMKEQEADGDLPAVAAAMQIIGASYVETLDTKGTDGSNVHLDGPATITGYFGGVGQPNDHALLWLDEFLYYYTTYGVRQVLNLNPGTVLAGYLLHRLGVDIEFKISVFMGNDNPYAGALDAARREAVRPRRRHLAADRLQLEQLGRQRDARDHGRRSGEALGFEDVVRFEHHITETWKSIVRQPYDRRDELIELADHVANISAKHEGGDPDVDAAHPHPSDILDYFRDKAEVDRERRLGRPPGRLHGQARRDEPHRAGADRARPVVRRRAGAAPLRERTVRPPPRPADPAATARPGALARACQRMSSPGVIGSLIQAPSRPTATIRSPTTAISGSWRLEVGRRRVPA